MGPGPWTEGEDREGEASERTTMLSSRSGIERERERKVRGKSSSKQTTAVGRSGSYDTRMLNPCWIAFLDRLLIALGEVEPPLGSLCIAVDCFSIYDIGVRYKY